MEKYSFPLHSGPVQFTNFALSPQFLVLKTLEKMNHVIKTFNLSFWEQDDNWKWEQDKICNCVLVKEDVILTVYFKFSILLRTARAFISFIPPHPCQTLWPWLLMLKAMWRIVINYYYIILDFPCQYSKANSHDKEVQRLYEEMEQQIKTEKERIRNEVGIPRYCITWCWARLNYISNFLCG